MAVGGGAVVMNCEGPLFVRVYDPVSPDEHVPPRIKPLPPGSRYTAC